MGPTPSLYEVIIERSLYRDGPVTSDKTRLSYFTAPHVALCGAYDGLHLRRVFRHSDPPATTQASSRRQREVYSKEQPPPERRITYAFGPLTYEGMNLAAGETDEDVWATFRDPLRRPLFACCEIRVADQLLAGGSSSLKECASLISETCREHLIPRVAQDHPSAQIQPAYLTLVSLGHSDLIVLLGGGSIDALLETVLGVRRLRLPSGASVCKTTVTHLGFICSDFKSDAWASFKNLHQRVQDVEVRTRPTLLCALRPGCETSLRPLKGFVADAGRPQAALRPQFEVTTGPFDVRIVLPQGASGGAAARVPDRTNAPPRVATYSQRALFAEYTHAFLQLLDAEDYYYLRDLRTRWEREEDLSGDHDLEGEAEQPRTETPASRRTPVDWTPNTSQPIVDDFERAFAPLLISDTFRRYLGDLATFREKLLTDLGLKDDGDPGKPVRENAKYIERDLQTMLRRATFVLLSRIVGGAPGDDPQMSIPNSAGTQKVAAACAEIARIVIETFSPSSADEANVLVGLNSIINDRTTTLYQRGRHRHCIIELPFRPGVEDDGQTNNLVDYFQGFFCRLIHEAAHTVTTRDSDAVGLREAFAKTVSDWYLTTRRNSPVQDPSKAIDWLFPEFDKDEAFRQSLGRVKDVKGLMDLDLQLKHRESNLFTLEEVAAYIEQARRIGQSLQAWQHQAAEVRADLRAWVLFGDLYVDYLKRRLPNDERLKVLLAVDLDDPEQPTENPPRALMNWYRGYHRTCKEFGAASERGRALVPLRNALQERDQEALVYAIIDLAALTGR